MDRVKKNFGFGCMRLPMKDNEVNTEELCRMVDTFLQNGFNYFDTAHGYVGSTPQPQKNRNYKQEAKQGKDRPQ